MNEDRPPLQDDEVIFLARKAIAQAREETPRRNDPDPDVVAKDLQQPGVTIDLGHHSIKRLPDDVVDIIKADIERLALSHNSFTTLPLRLSECARLRYLNVRYNALREFPPAILQIRTLEILDVSKNKIREIPDDIANLTSLKVLAIQRNRIEKLPVCLGDISSLHMLKLDGNPISFPPPEILNIKERATVPSGDNERDALITTQVKRYLRQVSTRQRLKVESEGDSRYVGRAVTLGDADGSSEGNMETPRPMRTRAGGRFPVKPSISGMDAFTDITGKPDSPGNAPPIPARSHARVQSQQSAASRRPPVAPLAVNGNERNRSHSEGTGSNAIRAKRMGMVSRKATELAPVTEGRTNNTNHSRGMSHGSALPEFSSNGFPADQSKAKMRPLSNLVEHKPWTAEYEEVVQAARLTAESAIDYLLPTERLLRRANVPGQPGLMTQFHRARTGAYALSELLERFDALTEDQEDEADSLVDKILKEADACLDALVNLEILLHDAMEDMSKAADDPAVRRAWRAQLNAQYMGTVEARNACEILGVEFVDPAGPKADGRDARVSTTPTQTAPRPSQRHPGQRKQGLSLDTNVAPNGGLGLVPPMQENGRSNTLTSAASAVTPRSGESFATLGSVSMSRSSTMQSMEEADEEQQFERIWQKLGMACYWTLQNMPVCHQRFEQACHAAKSDPERGLMTHVKWIKVLERSTEAHQAATSLNEVLASIKLRDSEFRASQRFWELCTAYVKTWSDLAVAVKDLGQIGPLPEDIKSFMKPIQKAVKAASILITSSPWSHLAVRSDSVSSFSTPTHFPPRSESRNYGHGHAFGNSINNTSSGPVPFVPGPTSTSVPGPYSSHNSTPASSIGHITPTPVQPATPMSAALGAAAQATVPSTPGHVPPPPSMVLGPTSTPVDPPITGRFAGNVFERADRLLQSTSRRV
ncbi:RAM signaling pathway protein-domain-containing protein [Phyllosticta paracitricarpa]|uniref:RAM signaling pathway protein-domain-containing protein n=1 Tax=Phyllosticta paracitricarpa TaxID=2016321 RepID=A0ABR1MYN2_9PEZI